MGATANRFLIGDELGRQGPGGAGVEGVAFAVAFNSRLGHKFALDISVAACLFRKTGFHFSGTCSSLLPVPADRRQRAVPPRSLFMDFIKPIILGVVEGVTEFIPVSSTG